MNKLQIKERPLRHHQRLQGHIQWFGDQFQERQYCWKKSQRNCGFLVPKTRGFSVPKIEGLAVPKTVTNQSLSLSNLIAIAEKLCKNLALAEKIVRWMAWFTSLSRSKSEKIELKQRQICGSPNFTAETTPKMVMEMNVKTQKKALELGLDTLKMSNSKWQLCQNFSGLPGNNGFIVKLSRTTASGSSPATSWSFRSL